MHLIIVSSMFCMQWCCCYCCYACTIFTPFSLSSSTLLVHYDYIICLFIFHTFSWGILIQSICFDCVIFHHVKSLLHSCNIFLYIAIICTLSHSLLCNKTFQFHSWNGFVLKCYWGIPICNNLKILKNW